MVKEISSEFNPNYHSNFYFIRKGLYEAIKENSHYLSGIMMDFGCGSKPYQNLFQVEKYIGLDYASDGHSHENEQIDVFYDGNKIPFSDNYFDSILCSEVLEHVFEIDLTLSELYRVLKPGGRILVTCPFFWNEHETPTDFARYTRFALKHIFEKHKFKIIKYEKKGSAIETIFQMINLNIINLIAAGGVFPKIPIVRGIMWQILKVSPILINYSGSFLNKKLPKFDDIYLSNILIVEKSES